MNPMTIQEITEQLSIESNPYQLAILKTRLAAEYARLCDILEGCLKTKADKWESFRKERTSDTQAERAWERTEEGIGEMVCRLRMKKIEKLMSSASSRISTAENDLKNNF